VKLYLLHADKRIKCVVPPDGAKHVTVPGACPLCGSEMFLVRGEHKHIAPDDRAYEADAIAECCGSAVGRLRLETDTLFGLEEDEAMLVHGRPRVYG